MIINTFVCTREKVIFEYNMYDVIYDTNNYIAGFGPQGVPRYAGPPESAHDIHVYTKYFINILNIILNSFHVIYISIFTIYIMD